MVKVIVVTQDRFFERCYESLNKFRCDPGLQKAKENQLTEYKKSVESILKQPVDELVVCGINDFHSTALELKREILTDDCKRPILVCLYAQYKSMPIKSKGYDQLLNLFDSGKVKDLYNVYAGYVFFGRPLNFLHTKRR